MFIEVKKVRKFYGENDNRVEILKGVSTDVEKGKMCVILGPSGSGKSTFLNIMGGIDTVSSGNIIVNGNDISMFNKNQLECYRRDYLGFIFQFYNLIPNLTLRENIKVCEYISNSPLNLDELIDVLGLKEHQHKYPSQVSGGQQQRCAIARALVKNPRLLLCDEPTGALDSKTSKEILILLERINKQYGTTMLIVTHNDLIQKMVHKIIKIKDGNICEDYENDNIISAKDIEF